MDTYWKNSNSEWKGDKLIFHECIRCGECIKVCPENFLYMEEYDCNLDGEVEHMKYVSQRYDYVPCHHCDGFWEDKTPCQQACPVDGCIEITRW